jgi:hypothetical protein
LSLRPASFHLLCGAIAVAVLAPRAAYAQNPAAAEALFEQARAAMAAGNYEIACARFRDSDKLDPAVGTRFNLADCEERSGRIATAWSLFRGVLSELGQDDDRKPIAEERAKALEPRMPYLTLLRLPETPKDARVRVDGIELGEGSLGVALPMDPGAHELALMSGGAEQKSSFRLAESQRLELSLRWASDAPSGGPATSTDAAAATPAAHADVAAPSADGAKKRQWAFVAGGIGVAGIAFGTVTGIVTISKKSTADANCSEARSVCNQAGVDANESGRTFGMLSVAGFGVGVAGLATAAYLWFTAPPAARGSAAYPSIPEKRRLARTLRSVTVAPQLGWIERTGFVAVQGSF